MRPVTLFLEAYTSLTRYEAIGRCEELILPYGFITDFRMFSNYALNLVIELPAGKVAPLLELLQHQDFLKLDKLPESLPGSNREVVLYLNLSFVHNDPELRIETPAVPG
jgi:hypothetical protein